ncbi:unnamed protein product, partial [Brassica rapa subsp. narinosa]
CSIYKLYCYPCLILKPLTTGEPLSSGRTESNSLDMNKTTKKKRGENTEVATHAKRRKQETNISGDRLPDALRDITNSSNNITKDARTERRLKLLQKRKNAEFGSRSVTQSEIVNVQSVGSTLPGSARSIDGESNTAKNKRRRLEKAELERMLCAGQKFQLPNCTAGNSKKISNPSNNISQATNGD